MRIAGVRSLRFLASRLRTQARLLGLPRRRSWRVVDGKFEMALTRDDQMDRRFYLGTYDGNLVSATAEFVRPGDTCIDIGADVGYVTLHLACRVGERGVVYAFEPDPRARAILADNCARNKMGNVHIVPYALGAEDGTATLHLSSQLGWSSMFPNELASGTVVSETKVPVRSLDGLVAANEVRLTPDRLSFVKVDCEGAEPLVLAGMRGLLRRANATLWVEINKASLEAASASPETVIELLTGIGYSVFWPRYRVGHHGGSNIGLSPITLDDGRSWPAHSNIVAAKPACGPE